jgi:hypothetical protein
MLVGIVGHWLDQVEASEPSILAAIHSLMRRGKMTKKQWNVNVADKPHIVEVEGGGWSIKGKLKVDGNTVKVWSQWLLLPKEVQFDVGGQKAFLKRKSTFASDFDLYVGDKKY